MQHQIELYRVLESYFLRTFVDLTPFSRIISILEYELAIYRRPVDHSTVSDVIACNFVDYGASKPQNYVRLKVCLQHVFIKHKDASVNSQNIQMIFFICTKVPICNYVTIYKNVDLVDILTLKRMTRRTRNSTVKHHIKY